MIKHKSNEIAIAGKELLKRIQTLTARETEVLNLLLKGLSNAQIALAIFRSPKTVDKHCQRIYRKLDVHRRVNLVRLCMESGYHGADSTHPLPPSVVRPASSKAGDDSYLLVEQLIGKSRAWDRLMEMERLLSTVSGPRYFGEFVCALSRVFGVKFAGITESRSGDTCGVIIAYSVDGELIPEMKEYVLELAPCKITLREGKCLIPEGACAAFPTDQFLVDLAITSYAGIRLDDHMLGQLGLVCLCDTKPMSNNAMLLETLSLIAPSVAAELAVQFVLDQAGDT